MASNSAAAAAAVQSTTTTTFVQADPSTFRAIVQRLTGAPTDPPRPPCRLHERRRSSKKLELELERKGGDTAARGMGIGMASPVSTLEFVTRGSPCEDQELEDRAIAEKGFYFRPSPRGSDPPQLLPLFPISVTPQHNHSSPFSS
ncbi:VQ motif-containing protein 11 [Momordica charantia]|uniref:VQ motif-containing protein 11 n=1 Tax=Momordica charantia TaxID=3673 RepID=A0A6J1DBD5_MOMCH|nr:VQ motif-containing protein 11 [Momordica charantia]